MSDELERISEAALESIYGRGTIDAGGARCFRLPEAPESSMLNRVVGLGVERAATDADIDEALRAMGETTFYVAVSPGARPSTLDAMLAARGLERGLGWVLFRRPPLRPRRAETTLRVIEAGSSEAPAWGRLVIDAFGLPDAALDWMCSVVGADGWHAWLALAGDEPAAAAAVWIGGDAAYFTFAGTAAGHRGKGGQNALLVARIERALDLGCRTLVTETGEPQGGPGASHRNILRNGFAEDHTVAHRLRRRGRRIDAESRAARLAADASATAPSPAPRGGRRPRPAGSRLSTDDGAEIGIDWVSSPLDVEQFRMGLEVELEHGAHDAETNVTGDDPIMTGKIAWAHLKELPDYYTRLAAMEADAEA